MRADISNETLCSGSKACDLCATCKRKSKDRTSKDRFLRPPAASRLYCIAHAKDK